MLAIAVEMQLLLIDRNDDFHRPFRDIAERLLAGVRGSFFGHLVLVHAPSRRIAAECEGEGKNAHTAEQSAISPAQRKREVPDACSLLNLLPQLQR